MNNFIATILVFGSSIAFATEETPSATVQEMFEKSEFIGIVTVVSGSYDANGYQLQGKVELGIKGNYKGTLEFAHLGYRWSDVPNSLGLTYLVFLSNTENGLETLNYQFSVIAVASVPRDREFFEDLWSQFKLIEIDARAIGNQIWFPTSCADWNEMSCKKSKQVFAGALDNRAE